MSSGFYSFKLTEFGSPRRSKGNHLYLDDTPAQRKLLQESLKLSSELTSRKFLDIEDVVSQFEIETHYSNDGFYYKLHSDKAVAPYKARFSDSGFDLTLIEEKKRLLTPSGQPYLIYYDTQVSLEPNSYHYFDLVARSSLAKEGWALANGVGIIDMSYRGTIIVGLTPLYPEANPLQLPCRCVQIIPRQLVPLKAIETTTLTETERKDDGGMGSAQFGSA